MLSLIFFHISLCMTAIILLFPRLVISRAHSGNKQTEMNFYVNFAICFIFVDTEKKSEGVRKCGILVLALKKYIIPISLVLYLMKWRAKGTTWCWPKSND